MASKKKKEKKKPQQLAPPNLENLFLLLKGVLLLGEQRQLAVLVFADLTLLGAERLEFRPRNLELWGKI